MIVCRSSFPKVIQALRAHAWLALDTETTGLRPWNGDRIFSLMIAWHGGADDSNPDNPGAFYFNFQPYANLGSDFVLGQEHFQLLQEVLFSDPLKHWFLHNAKFDMAMLYQEGCVIVGPVHCTQAQGRVEQNDHMAYSLDAGLKRIGLAKDAGVEKYIAEHKLWTEVQLPGRKEKRKNLHYDRVPFKIICPYGLSDARGTWALGQYQRSSIAAQSVAYPKNVPDLLNVSQIESRLTKTVFDMERVGVRIDRPYCVRAAAHEENEIAQAGERFKRATGREYQSSPKLFQEVFGSDRERWQYTEKGNPSFTSDILQNFENPAARDLLAMRDAESRYRFYTAFLYHADRDDVVHPNFNPGGTDTGRLSSSEPNFQNLTSEEGDEEKEFLVRRAIIPRPGFVFIMPDYDQVEYKLMLDYAKHMQIEQFKRQGVSWDEGYFEVANRVRDGFDIHQATADLVSVSRKQAKTLNFGLLYGMGKAKLAAALGVSLEEGGRIKSRYFAALPYVEYMVRAVERTVRERGWIRNWAGRKYLFPNGEGSFRAPNKLIQGGAADVLKVAMNEIAHQQTLWGLRSRMVLTIHDELPCEVHESELATYPGTVQKLMQGAYPPHYIPLTAGMEWSDKSLADKKKGFPV